MQLITFTGLSRSGNHVLIKWLEEHYKKCGYEFYFYNNTVTDFLEHINYIFPDVDKISKKIFFVSFEDITINSRFGILTRMAKHNFLLLRDPFNLFASRIMGLGYPRGKLDAPFGYSTSHMQQEIDLYLNHYEEFTNQTNYIQNKICIKYNEWFKFESIRKEIIEKIGLVIFEKEINPKFINPPSGSSFGSDKNYEDRWRSCLNEALYKPIKDNNTLNEITRNEFKVNLVF